MLSSQISYQIIRSSRKTMSLEIKADGSVVVRAPLRLSEAKIQKFVEEKQEWILKNLEKIQKRDAQKENVQKLSCPGKTASAEQSLRGNSKASGILCRES